MNAGDIIFLGSRDVRNLLSVEDCIPWAVEEAFRLHGEGKAQAPGVLGIHIVDGVGGFHIKAAGLLDLRMRYFAAKVNGAFRKSSLRSPDHPGRQSFCATLRRELRSPVMDSRDVTRHSTNRRRDRRLPHRFARAQPHKRSRFAAAANRVVTKSGHSLTFSTCETSSYLTPAPNARRALRRN